MSNKYLEFISDEHLIKCIAELYDSYQKAKSNISKKKFYNNKIDTFKLTFDSKFNKLNEDELIKNEILRQIDKSTNNSIGTFHENILGGINNYQKGNLSGYDIKANNDTLFADIKNKHNTMNSSSAESLFQKLAKYADTYKKAKCYWVQILAQKSFCQKWTGEINGKEYSHSRVYKISGDQFYALLTGIENALFQLYKILPLAIEDYLASIENMMLKENDSAIFDIIESAKQNNRNILEQITIDNFRYYSGFDKL